MHNSFLNQPRGTTRRNVSQGGGLVSPKMSGGDNKQFFYPATFLLLPFIFQYLAAQAASRRESWSRRVARHRPRSSPHLAGAGLGPLVMLAVLAFTITASALEEIPAWVHNDSVNTWIINDASTSWEIPAGTNQLVGFLVDGGESPNTVNCYDGTISQDLPIGSEGLGYYNPQYIHLNAGEFFLSAGMPPEVESQAYSDQDAYDDFMLGCLTVLSAGVLALGARWVRKIIAGDVESE